MAPKTYKIMAATISTLPARPDGIRTKIVKDYQKEYIVANGYSLGQQRVLASTADDIELEIDAQTYDRMEHDSTIAKCKQIIITNVLADDIQLAPGASEDNVGKDEYTAYVQIMEFCQRLLAGLERPIRETCEQLLGNALAYGNGIAESEWEYRSDGESTRPPDVKAPKKAKFSLWEKAKFWGADESAGQDPIKRPQLESEAVRLMPNSLKVKPRDAARFVVDDFMTVIGLVPTHRLYNSSTIQWNEVIDRTKFLIFTLKKKNEDPRGTSSYRPGFNWYNLKAQIPAEMLRFILEEAVPKAVGTLPENQAPFEFDRDEDGNILYEDADKKVPKMKTAAESFADQIKGFRSGSGAVIPHDAKLEPFKKNGAADADFFGKVLKVIDNQMENAILLQILAQSEGEHQARSAAQQVAELLHSLVFWIRWCLSHVLLYDLLEVAVKINFGDWAVRYLPQISFGDFVRRDWNKDLEAVADAYFKGFIDDSQRAELMSWLNLPKPGMSRQEQMSQNLTGAQQDINGNPGQPNNNRPDKQAGNINRNAGNGTEKKTNANSNYRFGPSNVLGYHKGWVGRFTRNIFSSRS